MGLFIARNGLVVRSGRIVAQIPAAVARPLTWLYWDVWWGSWLSWRLTCNPRTTYLVALGACIVAVAFGKRH